MIRHSLFSCLIIIVIVIVIVIMLSGFVLHIVTGGLWKTEYWFGFCFKITEPSKIFDICLDNFLIKAACNPQLN